MFFLWIFLHFLKSLEHNSVAAIINKPKNSIKRVPLGITFWKGNQPCSHNRTFPPCVSLQDVCRGMFKRHSTPNWASSSDFPHSRHRAPPQIKVPRQSLQSANTSSMSKMGDRRLSNPGQDAERSLFVYCGRPVTLDLVFWPAPWFLPSWIWGGQHCLA